MSKGWIKLDRQMTEHWLWKDKPFSYAQAWVDLLLKANHKPAKILIKNCLVELNRGDQARSERTLEKDWGWSRGKVRRFLVLLKSDNMIEQRVVPVTSIITICNYESFQGGSTTDDTSVSTSVDTTSEPQAVHKQECKNEKNVKKVKYSTDDLAASEWIYEKLLAMNPEHKKPNMDKWADTIRLMRESDNRTHKDICRVFAWANQDQFWSTNVLSPVSLRKNFDKLAIKANQPAMPITKGPSILNMQPPQPLDYIDHQPQGIEHAPE